MGLNRGVLKHGRVLSPKFTDWKPKLLSLGGKSALLERTKVFIFSLTLGPKLWYNIFRSARLQVMLLFAIRVCDLCKATAQYGKETET